MGKKNGKQSRTAEERAQAKRYLKLASAAMFGGVVSTTLLSTARPNILAQLTTGGVGGAGAAKRAAKLLGLIGTAGALCEFATGPAIGRLSDAEGRKKYVLGGMLTTAVLDMLVSLRPTSLGLLVVNGVVTTASNTAFITILRAGLADMFSGKKLGGAHAQTGIAAGVGVVIGPVLGSWITERFGAATAYRVASLMGFALAAYVSNTMEETLAREKRKPMDWVKANPLSFLKLLTSGREMSSLAVALGLQCIAEVRYLFPFANLLWLNKGYTPQQVGRFAGLFGVVYVLGAGLAKRRFKKLGPAAHVTESNIANALAFFIWSRWQGVSGSLAALIIMMGGIRKRDGLEVMITERGDKKGWGKGETTAITANFKSVSAVLAPTLLARSYSSAPGTGAPMLFCAVMTALSEMVFRLR